MSNKIFDFSRDVMNNQITESKMENNKNTADKNTQEIKLTNEYEFGGLKEYSLEKIEEEVLNQSVYLDVFAGSDLAFKIDVKKMDNILPLLSNLSVYKYRYNEKYSEENQNALEIGVMAQEIDQAFPELIKRDEQNLMHVNYSKLAALAVGAINELTERVRVLEDEISTLKKK